MAVEIASGIWELPKCSSDSSVELLGRGSLTIRDQGADVGNCVVLDVLFPLLGLQAGTGAVIPTGIAPGVGLEFCVGACSSWRSRIQEMGEKLN